ncbi:MAG TPA: hypothetical protein VHK01_21350, partial [Lacipirellulaceae bacterium]|nr:hypothetical protein [Lacipirellulaceae bacterium]
MMLRHVIAAAVILMSLAPPSTAAVTISASASPTQGLPGYNTWLLRAHSDAPMQGFDFAGDKSNDPATGRGFFGPMNQINPFAHPTIFSDNNIVIDVIVGSSSWDSQFLVNTRDIVVPAFFAEE